MESRLFEEGTIPECTTPEWYAGREAAPHLEQYPHRLRLEQAARYVGEAVQQYGVRTVSDLGCGDGGLLSLLKPLPIMAWGYDLQETNVEASKARDVDVRYGDVLTQPVELGDLCVVTEMLEHLVDPHAFVRRLYDSDTLRVVVASSPYTETYESHYAFHTWAWDVEGYSALFGGKGFVVTEHTTVDMFQVLMAVRP